MPRSSLNGNSHAGFAGIDSENAPEFPFPVENPTPQTYVAQQHVFHFIR